jgi:hypothetical protein
MRREKGIARECYDLVAWMVGLSVGFYLLAARDFR